MCAWRPWRACVCACARACVCACIVIVAIVIVVIVVIVIVIAIVLDCMYLLNFVYVLSHLIMTSKRKETIATNYRPFIFSRIPS